MDKNWCLNIGIVMQKIIFLKNESEIFDGNNCTISKEAFFPVYNEVSGKAFENKEEKIWSRKVSKLESGCALQADIR